MTAKEMYRALNRGFQKELPSGITVTMRIVNVADFLRRGELPSALQDVVLRMAAISTGDNETKVENDEYMRFKDWVVVTALIDPPVTLEPVLGPEDALQLTDIPPIDQDAIYSAALTNIKQSVENLTPFLESQEPASS